MHETVYAQWLHVNVLTNYIGHLGTAQKGRKDGKWASAGLFGCMCRTSIGQWTNSGPSRKAHGVDEEKLLQAAAEALHERAGSSKGMDWCMGVIQKSFLQRKRCPELPTVRQPSNLLPRMSRHEPTDLVACCLHDCVLPCLLHTVKLVLCSCSALISHIQGIPCG